MESFKSWPDGFIVRELSRVPSNFRSDMTIQLKKCDLFAIFASIFVEYDCNQLADFGKHYG